MKIIIIYRKYYIHIYSDLVFIHGFHEHIRGVFRSQWNIFDGALFAEILKSF